MNDLKVRKLPIHYAWVIAVTGTFCIIACLGLGRFALGMLLPSMAKTLNLNYSQMGFISTGNFIGYLISVFFSGFIVSKLGQRIFIFFSLLIVGISMLLLSFSNAFLVLLILYWITGLGSGGANVSMMSLVSSWFTKKNRGKGAGLMTIGSGFAIIFSGLFIPYVNQIRGSEGWRFSWFFLGAIVIIIAFLCLIVLRNRPSDMGLEPLGHESEKQNHNLISDKKGDSQSIYRNKIIYHLGIIYFLFGYTYVIYATFIVTTLVKERGFSESVAGTFWSWVGLLSLFSGPVFGIISDKFGRKTGLIIVFTFQCLSYLLVATKLPGIFLYLSIFFYGFVAWSIPTIMAAAVGDYVGPQSSAKAFGFITFIFGLGQITGPAIAGIMAQKTGSFSSSFYMSAILAGLAIILSMLLKKPR
ncbi:MAG: MFS transporter [Proteobacteria bacterium]|nr:MFS transporter [Pseudomonadota bacterium]